MKFYEYDGFVPPAARKELLQKGFFCYGLRQWDSSSDRLQLEDEPVIVNHWGDLITDTPIKFRSRSRTGFHYIQNYYKWLDYHDDYEQMNETEQSVIDQIIRKARSAHVGA